MNKAYKSKETGAYPLTNATSSVPKMMSVFTIITQRAIKTVSSLKLGVLNKMTQQCCGIYTNQHPPS